MSCSPFGGSLSCCNKGGFSANAGVTGSYKGMKAGMGISVSGQGVGGSFSIGYGKNMNTKSARGGAGSISMSSFSAGDFSFNSRFYIPLTIGVLSFGFGIETEIKLEQANNKNAYGTLYHNQSSYIKIIITVHGVPLNPVPIQFLEIIVQTILVMHMNK